MQKRVEQIRRLIAQFESVSYDEDRLEILSEIHTFSQIDPVAVGTLCLTSIFKSVFEMDETEIHYKILERIFSSSKKDEFVDDLFCDQMNLNMLLDLSVIEVVYFLDTVNSSLFLRRLANQTKIEAVLIRAVEIGELEKNNRWLDELFATKKNEIFDRLLDSNKAVSRLFKSGLLEKLLNDSLINQTKFMETEVFRNNTGKISINGIRILLNKENSRYSEVQQIFMKRSVIENGLINKDYELIYNLIYGSDRNTAILVEYCKNNKVTEVVERDSADFYYAANILDIFLGIDQNIPCHNWISVTLANISNINTELDCDYSITDQKYLIYEIFVHSRISENDILKLIYECHGVIRELALFIGLMCGYSTTLSPHEILITLIQFRMHLINNKMYSTKIDEMLLGSVSDFIKLYNEYLYEESTKKSGIQAELDDFGTNLSDENVVVKTDAIENENETGMLNIENLARLNKGIQNVLRFFRRKEDE
ncbi:hypothetical protein ECANGB1_644 [Enterospora canceri]|uniref:Uncharacterized protein n=1 Tax=Enterospora canceri TaxID=1081671 RepID=A0A1Y1S8W2_9MICR|nr:hypothetical protein ECANGB1_644 [Enterospora canceri]